MLSEDAGADSGADDPIESLLAQCLVRAETEGAAAIDEICARHPEHAETLRRELGVLRALGLFQRAGGGAAETEIERAGSIRPSVRLDALGTTPAGFVRVSASSALAPPDLGDFWLQEREVTFTAV